MSKQELNTKNPKHIAPSDVEKSMKGYDHKSIEPYWQKKWLEEKIYQPNLDTAEKPFYNLMMFPYPSAEGLHVGSFFTYGGIDAYGRFKRMQGYDVFEPIGLDGFGIHSENYAIKVGRTPQQHAQISEDNFYRQLHMLGNAFDWSRKLETYDPRYYKWTQWLFVELFKAGLAYKASASVNFCPSCKTVLSDEQVIDGKCERCSSIVEKRELEQWFFRITDYAERLLQNTNKLDWSEKVKIAQKNWIGKSTGALVTFRLDKTAYDLTVFTTRPDTLYGATFLVVAPEHPVIKELEHLVTDAARQKEIEAYIHAASKKETQERLAEGKEKTGVFSGIYAVNPVTNEAIPVWIADYVLMDYGTGAIMAVPAHDQRDFDFAMKYHLPIKTVIVSKSDIARGFSSKPEIAFTGEGVIVDSEEWNGWETPDSIEKVVTWLEKKEFGKKSVNYHLRDWLISRQRYWGPPIPMIFCEKCAKEGKSWFTKTKGGHKHSEWNAAGWYPEDQLPVMLPIVDDFKPLGTGKAPLANYPEFYETKCPGCGAKAKRETDVSDTFLDSSWYFLRYLVTEMNGLPIPMTTKSASNFNGASVEEKEQVVDRLRWLPVTSYIGGAEHAVLHLLYSRFVTMVLHDLGYISFDEPFAKFRANGLIIKDGAKMSKSKGNVINPDDYIRKFGSDTLRTYLGFIGPFTQGGDFQDAGIEGINRFLKRVWNLISSGDFSSEKVSVKQSIAMMHKTVKGATEDMEELRFNTVIAKAMSYYNYLSDQKTVHIEEITVLLKILAPFAPHMTEELWHSLGHNESIHIQKWPEFDVEKIISDMVTIAVQVNGKLRGTVEVSSEDIKEQKKVEALARENDTVKKFLESKDIKKVIYVPGKIVNFVVA